jgi:hypothetical protein
MYRENAGCVRTPAEVFALDQDVELRQTALGGRKSILLARLGSASVWIARVSSHGGMHDT